MPRNQPARSRPASSRGRLDAPVVRWADPPRRTSARLGEPLGGSPRVRAGRLALILHPDRERVVVELCGALDEPACPALERELRALVRSGFSDVVLELRGLRAIGAAGARLLLDLLEEARRDGWRLRLDRAHATFAHSEPRPAGPEPERLDALAVDVARAMARRRGDAGA